MFIDSIHANLVRLVPFFVRLILTQKLKWRVALIFCAVIAGWGFTFPGSLTSFVDRVLRATFSRFDNLLLPIISILPLLLIGLALSPWGRLRLGADDEDPEFSRGSWFAMLFAAGMGVGLMFWGLAEPMQHWETPPIGTPKTPAALELAMAITCFHWGLHAWGIYGISGLTVAYFGFRRKRSLVPGAPVLDAFSGTWASPVAWLIDLLAIVAVAFGVAGSIGVGVLQLRSGLHEVLGTPADSAGVTLVVVVVLTLAFLASAATRLNKGIKWLSNINMLLALALLLFLFLVGPTTYQFETIVASLRGYLMHLPSMSFDASYFGAGHDWLHRWSLNYFVWWVSWAPFVGVFIARISRGRTIREFVWVVLLAPTVLSIGWFACFGGAGLFEEMVGLGGISVAVQKDIASAIFILFQRYPLTLLLSAVALILVFVFLVTSADSATFVLGMMSTGQSSPPRPHKLTWGMLIGGLGAAFALTNNVDSVKALAVFGAVPFIVVMLIQIVALLRVLKREGSKSISHE